MRRRPHNALATREVKNGQKIRFEQQKNARKGCQTATFASSLWCIAAITGATRLSVPWIWRKRVMLSDRVSNKAPKNGDQSSRKLPLKGATTRNAAPAKKAAAYNGQAFGSFLGACP